ncbi:hypothetical protein K7T73_12840 [Bacillus badius]|uniref:hypothetical protein n=1 Tax=Bacillus badius TaxID=1455 RepID=UPI001CBB8889|nr:hypothetical protein [Bacillus badius]UAT29486.1 hypothetical protein K7T73_12840 [Bacillus badius]
MLTVEERRQLKSLLELLDQEEQKTNKRDVSNRSRSQDGRFLPESKMPVEDLPSSSARKIKLVKVKGSFGTYLVQTKWLTEAEKDILIVCGLLGLLALIF